MTTYNYVDPQLHVATLPTTYVPPGSLVAVSAAQASGTTLTAANAATYLLLANCVNEPDLLAGYITAAGNKVVIPVGFFPTKVEVINWTDTKKYEWLYGAPASDSWYTVASADPTVDTGTAIAVTADAAGGNGNVCYVSIASAVAINNKVLSFRIVK